MAFRTRPRFHRLVLTLVLPLAVGLGLSAAEPPARQAPPKINGAIVLDWDDLLPEKERSAFDLAAPPADHYLSEGGPMASQSGSAETVSTFNGEVVKVPGFIVPLSITASGMVSEFFLVPYYGACIHVPPPPPNQIVYVKMDKQFELKSIYDPVWVTGVMKAETMAVQMASAAYTVAGQKITPYEY